MRGLRFTLPSAVLSVFVAATTGSFPATSRLPQSARSSSAPLPQHAANKDSKEAAARHLLTEAENLRAQWNEASIRESIAKLSAALPLWQATDRHDELAQTLISLGDSHLLLSEYKQAETNYLKAAETAAISDASLKYRAFARAGYVNVYLSQNKKALQYAELALNYYSRVRSRPESPQQQRDEAEAQNTAGEAHYSMDRLNQATKLFMHALQLWQAAGDQAGQARANLNLAYCYSDLGDPIKARDSLDAALTLSRAAGDKRGEALALTAYGTIQSFWGEKQAALDNHGAAMNILRMMGNHAGEAVALNSIATAYEELNEPRVALDKYHQALAIYEQLGNGEFEAVTRCYIGRVHRTLGENHEALSYFQQCLGIGRRIGHGRLKAYALTAISGLRNAEGHGDEALRGLQQVLSLYQALRDRRGQANVLTEMGRIYEARRQSKRALESYRQALSFNRAAGDRNGEATALYLMALSERNLGALDDALQHIEESNQVTESLRTQIVSPDLRASYFASVQKHSALHSDLLMRLDKLHPEKHLTELAFEINDSARARALLETISESSAKIRQGVDPALLARERALQEQLTARGSYHMRALNADEKAESDIAEQELRELTTAYQELQTQIRQQSPRYINLISPEPLKLKEIQAELRDPNTMLLEYALGDERSYVWAITADSFAAFELPARNKIETLTQEAIKSLTARQMLAETEASDYTERAAASDLDYWREAAILSDTILGPVAHLIPGKRLLIVAEGKLQYLPFAALPVPGEGLNRPPEERVPLVTVNEMVNLPSASLLTAIRVGKPVYPGGKLVAVLADPVFERTDPRVHSSAGSMTLPASLRSLGVNDIPRLLATREEAEEIMAVTPSGEGFVATDFNAGRALATTGELGQYQIVHFATHGIVNTQHPELSGIVLSLVNSNGQSEDGFLQLHDIYNLDLSRTQLVVLSACQTALGKEVNGEGLMGLTRGFMYAGSKSVIASLWKVDDRATAELMKHFYRAMFDEGLPPSAALRKAKEAMWQQPRWRAPYFWAGFILQGEYRDTIVVNRNNNTWMYSAMAVGAFSLLMLGRYATKRVSRSRSGALSKTLPR